jgi:hypothetical protein
MSALEAPVPARAPQAELRAVAPPGVSRPWPAGVFPLMILALLAAGMVGHLALQTKIQQQGFELGDLQSQAERLAAQEAILSATLDGKSTPQQLAFAAASLGMVANPYTTFVTLPSGAVTGMNLPVRGDEVPIISALPTPPAPPTAADLVDQASQPTTPNAAPDAATTADPAAQAPPVDPAVAAAGADAPPAEAPPADAPPAEAAATTEGTP